MNPSTAELLAAVEASGAREAILLPNDRNVLLAAEHAAEAARGPGLGRPDDDDPGRARRGARVRPRRSRARRTSAAMSRRRRRTSATGAVTIASRDVETNGVAIRKGAWLGLADGEPGRRRRDVRRGRRARSSSGCSSEPRGILTLLTGEEPQPLDGLLAELADAHPELELEVHEGGQPHYALLLARRVAACA